MAHNFSQYIFRHNFFSWAVLKKWRQNIVEFLKDMHYNTLTTTMWFVSSMLKQMLFYLAPWNFFEEKKITMALASLHNTESCQQWFWPNNIRVHLVASSKHKMQFKENYAQRIHSEKSNNWVGKKLISPKGKRKAKKLVPTVL